MLDFFFLMGFIHSNILESSMMPRHHDWTIVVILSLFTVSAVSEQANFGAIIFRCHVGHGFVQCAESPTNVKDFGSLLVTSGIYPNQTTVLFLFFSFFLTVFRQRKMIAPKFACSLLFGWGISHSSPTRSQSLSHLLGFLHIARNHAQQDNER